MLDELDVNIEKQCRECDKEGTKYSQTILCQWHFFHKNPAVYWRGTEPGSLRRDTDDNIPELRCIIFCDMTPYILVSDV